MLYVLPCIFTDFVHAVQFMHICILNSFFPNNFVDLIKLCFFGHLRYCHHLVPVIYKFLHCVIFFSETTGPIGTKICRNVHWMVPFKVCFYLLIRGTQKKREFLKFRIFERYIEYLFFIQFWYVCWMDCVESFRQISFIFYQFSR
jgi:hypothetical protein